MALPLFAVTLFVSAFVLFLVQPMIGKMILPKLGGTPQVWNTCMVFFQSALLAGYAYSHWLSTRLPLKKQLLVHAVVLFIPIIVLIPPIGPFNIANWVPPPGGNPIFDTLRLLTLIVGLPFFAVSTTAPLLQKWFSRTKHPTAHDPYYLYSASNIGSLLSLAAYPFLVERMVGLEGQRVLWAAFYVILALFILACAWALWKTPGVLDMPILVPETPTAETPVPPPDEAAPAAAPSTAIKPGPAPSASQKAFQKKKGPILPKTREPAKPVVTPSIVSTGPSERPITMWRRLRWVLLAAVPSSLMLGVTSYISVDLSPFPLVWAIPLSLYLISFILVFSQWPTPWVGTPHDVVLFAQPFGILAMGALLISGAAGAKVIPMLVAFLGFFLTALALHGELARDRPSPRYLTEFFLLMSLGGMLGGFFNGIVAPLVFTWVAEYPLALLAACFLRPATRARGWTEDLVVYTFPQIESWAVEQGDALAAKAHQPPPRTPWLLAWIFDVVLGILGMLLLMFLIRYFFGTFNWRRPWTNEVLKFFNVIGFEAKTADGASMQGRLIFVYIPMAVLFLYSSRPVRFGLGLFVLLWMLVGFLGVPPDTYLPGGAKRTYFGVLRVYEEAKPLNPETKDGTILKTQTEDPYLVVRHEDDSINEEATRQLLGVDFPPRDEKGKPVVLMGRSTGLMHGSTHHGQNFHYPPGLRRLATTYYHRLGPVGAIMERYNWFEKQKTAKERLKSDGQNRYTGDGRLPAAMVGLGFAALDSGLPMDQIADAFSEAPYATIGLGTGTMASYARPYQHVTFYEIDDQIRMFSEPFDFPIEDLPMTPEQWAEKLGSGPMGGTKAKYQGFDAKTQTVKLDVGGKDRELPISERTKVLDFPGKAAKDCLDNFKDGTNVFFLTAPEGDAKNSKDVVAAIWSEKIGMGAGDPIRRPYFTYLHDAALRGATVEVVMGDARTSMELELRKPGQTARNVKWTSAGYWQLVNEDGSPASDINVPRGSYPAKRGYFPLREQYYKVIEVDAFSSDAIPIHLITKEAIQVYLDHIADDGVVMVHTSNRHVDLVQPVVNIVHELNTSGKLGYKIDYRVANDIAITARGSIAQDALGHTGSEYVMLAKHPPDDPPAWFKELAKNKNAAEEAKAKGDTRLADALKSGWPGMLKYEYRIPGQRYKLTVESRAPLLDAYYHGEKTREWQEWEPSLQPVGRAMVGWYILEATDDRVWTDDYSNILQIYK